MNGYILTILGIVIAGLLIDIILPFGSINKYIKGVYSLFVVAVLVNPIVKFLKRTQDFTISYEEYNINKDLLDYIYNKKVLSLETDLEEILSNNGFSNIDITLEFSIQNNELTYNSCKVNLKNLVISADKQHINKYEFITNIVKENTNLTNERIIINEWRKKENITQMAWKV